MRGVENVSRVYFMLLVKIKKNVLFPASRQTFVILFHDTQLWSSYFFPFKTLLDISPFGLLNTAHVQDGAQKLIHAVLSSYKQLDLPSGIRDKQSRCISEFNENT